jgi:hypothetical protein
VNLLKANCFLSFFLILSAFSLTFGQEIGEENSSETNQTQTFEADEFGRLGDCAFSARLDNFAILLQNKPEAAGYIIAYRSADILPSQIESKSYLRRAQHYLVNTRGIDANRIKVIDGGFRKEETTEIWLVPPGGAVPEASDTVPVPVIPKGKTYLYDKGFFEDVSEFALPVAEDFIEEPAEENTESEKTAESEEIADLEETEPEELPEETSELTEEELEALKFGWLDERIADLIKKEKKSRSVIIFYADEIEYDINKIRAHIEEGRTRLIKNSGLSAEHFEIVFGGYRASPEIELWFVPPAGEVPIATPGTKQIEETAEEPQKLEKNE